MKKLLLLFFCLLSVAVYAQDSKKSTYKFGLEGTVAVTSDLDKGNLYFNVGSASFLFKLPSNFKLGVAAFPSLMVPIDRKAIIEPKLGFGPKLEYKQYSLICPFYFFSTPTRKYWNFSVGLGYKFK